MSTLAYAALTTRRLASETDQESGAEKLGITPFVDAMAALVPAEVLGAHAVIVGLLSTVTKGQDGKDVTVLTHPNYLNFAFYALLTIAAALYLIGRVTSSQHLRPIDILLVMIPPAAFVAWSMLQPTTVLDSVVPQFQVPGRSVVGVLIAIVLAALARWGGVSADNTEPDAK